MQRDAQTISDIMRRVKSRDTTPEVLFRKALWAQGLRYRLYVEDLPGKPDIVIPGKRLAIFIDGDFWHGNQWETRNLKALDEQFSDSKKTYWLNKIQRNMARDCANTASLVADDWNVLRFWSSDVQHHLEQCLDFTFRTLERNGSDKNGSLETTGKTAAEFFAGIGLVRLGLEQQGWRVLFANDLDEQKYELYAQNFADARRHYALEDIHNLRGDDIPTVTLATASFPCNDLSLAGKYKGLDGEHSSSVWGLLRILKEMDSRRPPLVMLENVPSFLSSHKGKDFERVLTALNELDYVCDTFIVNAANFTPQSRARIFVIAIREDSEAAALHPIVPETPVLLNESTLRPQKVTQFIFSHPDIRWKIRNLPNPPQRTTTLIDVIEEIPQSAPIWWSQERADYLRNQMSDRHGALADRMVQGEEYSYGTVFRRVRHKRSMGELRVDGMAGALRTPRGGSGRQILFKAGKGRYFARLLTPRECARLQGVPDTYTIDVPLNQALFGFGDAVCVPVITWIAQYYLNPLVNMLLRGRLLSRGTL